MSSDLSPSEQPLEGFDTSHQHQPDPSSSGEPVLPGHPPLLPTSSTPEATTITAGSSVDSPPQNTAVMTTSVNSEQSEASTLIGVPDFNTSSIASDDVISRDLSSEALHSSLMISPEGQSTSSSSSAAMNANVLFTGGGDDAVFSNETVDGVRSKPKSNNALLRVSNRVGAEGDNNNKIPSVSSTKSLGFSYSRDQESVMSSDPDLSGEEENASNQVTVEITDPDIFTDDIRHQMVDGTMDPEIFSENIQREVTLLRQVSQQFSDEKQSEREKADYMKNVAWGVAIGVLATVTVMYVYKRVKGK